MPEEIKKTDVEGLYIKDEDDYDVESPSGLEEEPVKKPGTGFVNKPRSSRIILVVAICLLAIMVTVLFNLGTSSTGTSGKKRNNNTQGSRELSTEFISSTISGMELDTAHETTSDKTQEDGTELVLANDGSLVPAGENARTESTRVVYMQPTDDYRRAKEMFVQGLYSDTSVSHASVRDTMERSKSHETNRGMDLSHEVDAATAYNAGLQAGISQQIPTDADRNNSFIGSQQHPSSTVDEYVQNTRRQKLGRYELNAGTIISAVMLTGINSDLPGTILGQVSENIYDTATGAHLLVPQGSKILGTYNSHVVYGQQRILVVWTRIIYPDGSSLNIGGMSGSDQAGYAGMKQYVNNHYGRLLGAALFSSVFVALGKEATKNDKNEDGTESSASEAIMEQMTSFGVRLAERNLNIAPTLLIKPGRRFTIITTKDVAFRETY